MERDEITARRDRKTLEAQIIKVCTDIVADEDLFDLEDEYTCCECEIDWNCGCGRYGGFTYIETRYDHLDDGER